MDFTISDMYYLQLPTGGPSQADVWSDLPTGVELSERRTGVIITPRCDFAHAKSPVVNFLPVVELEEYILSTACFAVLESQIKEAHSSLNGKAEAAGFGAYVNLGLPPCELEQLVKSELQSSSPEAQKKQSKSIQELDAGIKRITELEALSAKSRLTVPEAMQVLGPKKFTKLQRDIIRNNTTDTYFLPPCEGIFERPAVVLLRHIYTCPITTVGGYHPRSSYVEADSAILKKPERLLRIKSPFAESLMAKFSALFTRVGTRDLPEHCVDTYIISEQENAQ